MTFERIDDIRSRWFDTRSERSFFKKLGYGCVFAHCADRTSPATIGWSIDPITRLTGNDLWVGYWAPSRGLGTAIGMRASQQVSHENLGEAASLIEETFRLSRVPLLTHDGFIAMVRAYRQSDIDRQIKAAGSLVTAIAG